MDLTDVTPENFFKKVTYSSDQNPGNKLVVSNGMFVQCAVHLKLIQAIEKLRMDLK
jgi:hypothetical protein